MAAGQGFKTFTTGEVLTAGDVNGYLMQGINVFASNAARDAAITSPQEGQFAYTKDTNSLWYYTGSAWAASGATGDIEGVTAGVGISGGGTSGTVTITNSMATEIAAKGDLIAGTGSQTFDNLTVGANNTVLTADSSTATGLKWATPSSGGYTAIATGTLSSTGVTFSSISGTYVNLELHITGYNVNGNRLYVRINGDSGNNYAGFYARERNASATTGTYVGAGPTLATSIKVDGEVSPSGSTNSTVLRFPAYTTTTGKKIIEVSSYAFSTYNIPSINPFAYTGTDAAITSITILPETGTFAAGTYTLYGVK